MHAPSSRPSRRSLAHRPLARARSGRAARHRHPRRGQRGYPGKTCARPPTSRPAGVHRSRLPAACALSGGDHGPGQFRPCPVKDGLHPPGDGDWRWRGSPLALPPRYGGRGRAAGPRPTECKRQCRPRTHAGSSPQSAPVGDGETRAHAPVGVASSVTTIRPSCFPRSPWLPAIRCAPPPLKRRCGRHWPVRASFRDRLPAGPRLRR